MVQEFRYSLTRICLRTGQFSLSQRMAESFPDGDRLLALDTVDGRELELQAAGSRRISGLGEYLSKHRLKVNDIVQLRLLDDGRVALTALPRRARGEYGDSRSTAELLDGLLHAGPCTEQEIRTLHPDLPPEFPLVEVLEADPRFRRSGGRWVATSESEKSIVPESTLDPAGEAPESEPEARLDSVPDSEPDREPDIEHDGEPGSGRRGERESAASGDLEAPAAEAGVRPGPPAAARAAPESAEEAPAEIGGAAGRTAEQVSWLPESRPPAAEAAEQSAPAGVGPPIESQGATEEAGPGGTASSGATGGEAPKPPAQSGDRWRRRDAESEGVSAGSGRLAAVTPYPRGVLFPGEAALNSKRPDVDLELLNRARGALTSFGYRVEGLAPGMLLARAELGRKRHSVLIRVLAEGERLDWAALLARRREHALEHLAVFGDHRDLHRLTAPAELARATLWSWDGLARVQNLASLIPIGPFDLEPHFVKNGMFGTGLQQFERSVGALVGARGVFSTVLSRLAALRAPCVFLLDDLIDPELPRDRVLKVLEQLSEAPFHLIGRLDRGEYCLRHRVDEALQQLSQYALSLGEQLPSPEGERIEAAAEQPRRGEVRRIRESEDVEA